MLPIQRKALYWALYIITHHQQKMGIIKIHQ